MIIEQSARGKLFTTYGKSSVAGKVVRKDLVRKVKVGANVPVFVLEFLLGKYCATEDPVAIDAGLKVVNNTLSSNFVRPDEANKAQSMLTCSCDTKGEFAGYFMPLRF
jgi:predicted ATP-dependent Lon-type protease